MNSPQVEETAKRLLFFGNSFSVYDDVPGHVRSLAALAGHPTPLVVADLAYHIGQVDSYPENNVAHASLVGTNTWDWVVIQGYSTEATHLRDPAVFEANALALYQRVKNHASGKGAGASPLLFQTWARAAPGNYLRLADGFVASKSRPDYVLSGRIQVWDADDRTWEAGLENLNCTRTKYATEESAFAATGYTGLGGYYVYAGGDDYAPPPEPVVFILK